MAKSTIISLYESNYPVVKSEEPNWEELPCGFFMDSRSNLKDINTKQEGLSLFGNYYHSKSFKPRSGEHLLAVFSYKKKRYLYFSTISYTNEIEILNGRNSTWWCRLALTKLQRTW